jgi:hypothetical protein
MANMTRPSKKYIRNRDTHNFNKSEYSTSRGVVLTKYYGTIMKAKAKGVPVYNQSGTLTHRP